MIYSQFIPSVYQRHNLFGRLHVNHQTYSYGVKNYFRLAPVKGAKIVIDISTWSGTSKSTEYASHTGYHTVGVKIVDASHIPTVYQRYKHTYSDLYEVDKVTMSPILLMDTSYHNRKISKVIRTNDPLSASLTTIRNAYYQSFETCYVSNSKLIQELLSKIVDIGYINSWYFTSTWSGTSNLTHGCEYKNDPHMDMKSSNREPSIIINLKYYQNRPAIRGITQISKPGKRAYFSKQRLLKISELNNWGENKTLFLTTSQGIFSHHELCLRHTKRARSTDNEVNVRSTSQLGGGEALCLVW